MKKAIMLCASGLWIVCVCAVMATSYCYDSAYGACATSNSSVIVVIPNEYPCEGEIKTVTVTDPFGGDSEHTYSGDTCKQVTSGLSHCYSGGSCVAYVDYWCNGQTYNIAMDIGGLQPGGYQCAVAMLSGWH